MQNPPFDPEILTNKDPYNILYNHDNNPVLEDIEEVKHNHGSSYYNKRSARPLRVEQYTLPEEII